MRSSRRQAWVLVGVVLGALVPLTAWTPEALAHTLDVAGARLPNARDAIAAVWDGQHAYTFGGWDGARKDQIHWYDPATDTLTLLDARLPQAVQFASAVWDGHAAYLFGGVGANSAQLADIVRFDPATGQVATMAAQLPSGRGYASVVWDGRFAYVFGGCCRHDDIVRYDPATDTVQLMGAALPTPRDYTSAVWDGRYAYVFGGNGPTDLDEIVRYDPATDQAEVLPLRLPLPGHGAAALLVRGEAYVFGGRGPYGERADVVRFDPATGTLALEPWALPKALSNMGAASAEDRGFLFGGYHQGQLQATILHIDGRGLDPPRDLLATAGPDPGAITLTWKPGGHAEQDGVTHVQVHRGTTPGGEVLVARVPSAVLSFHDAGLDLAQTYYYVVRAETPSQVSESSKRACSAPYPMHLAPSASLPCDPPPGWSERVVLQRSATQAVGRSVVLLDGAPHPLDSRYYVVSGSLGTATLPTLTLYTAGLVQEPVHLDVPSPAERATVTVRVLQRLDATQAVCLGSVGSLCAAPLPLDPGNAAWLLDEAPRSELVVEVLVATDGTPVAHHAVRVPFAGQVLPVPPSVGGLYGLLPL